MIPVGLILCLYTVMMYLQALDGVFLCVFLCVCGGVWGGCVCVCVCGWVCGCLFCFVFVCLFVFVNDDIMNAIVDSL